MPEEDARDPEGADCDTDGEFWEVEDISPMEKEASSECSEDFPMSEEEDPHTSVQLVIYRLSHFLPAANTFPFMPAFPGVRIFS